MSFVATNSPAVQEKLQAADQALWAAMQESQGLPEGQKQEAQGRALMEHSAAYRRVFVNFGIPGEE